MQNSSWKHANLQVLMGWQDSAQSSAFHITDIQLVPHRSYCCNLCSLNYPVLLSIGDYNDKLTAVSLSVGVEVP